MQCQQNAYFESSVVPAAACRQSSASDAEKSHVSCGQTEHSSIAGHNVKGICCFVNYQFQVKHCGAATLGRLLRPVCLYHQVLAKMALMLFGCEDNCRPASYR